MASDKDYLEFVLEQFSLVDGVEFRAMMGEYILYLNGRIFGGIYDDRLLIKPTKTAKTLMADAPLELPYEGGKEMLLVENIEDKEFLKTLVEGMFPELPAPKKKKQK